MNPLVSIIILSYNQSEYLQDAVESVLNQTYTNWELIIIDNGSTDGSRQLLKKYEHLPNVRLILHDENGRITKRSNEGVRLSSGDFVSILFSDDYYLPEKLKKQVKCFEGLSSEWGVVHSPAYGLNVFSGAEKMHHCIPASGYILKDLFVRYHEGFINPITPLIRRECLERYPFYEDIFTEGEGIFFRIAMKYKFCYLGEPLAVMREHNRNMRFSGKKNADIFCAVIDKVAKHSDFPKEYLPCLRTLKSRILRNYGWQDARLGQDSKWAKIMFFESIKTEWMQMFHPRTMIGGCLVALPDKSRMFLNRLINRAMRREKIHYFEDYYK